MLINYQKLLLINLKHLIKNCLYELRSLIQNIDTNTLQLIYIEDSIYSSTVPYSLAAISLNLNLN